MIICQNWTPRNISFSIYLPCVKIGVHLSKEAVIDRNISFKNISVLLSRLMMREHNITMAARFVAKPSELTFK